MYIEAIYDGAKDCTIAKTWPSDHVFCQTASKLGEEWRVQVYYTRIAGPSWAQHRLDINDWLCLKTVSTTSSSVSHVCV